MSSDKLIKSDNSKPKLSTADWPLLLKVFLFNYLEY
jgi:hypothetical protein